MVEIFELKSLRAKRTSHNAVHANVQQCRSNSLLQKKQVNNCSLKRTDIKHRPMFILWNYRSCGITHNSQCKLFHGRAAFIEIIVYARHRRTV